MQQFRYLRWLLRRHFEENEISALLDLHIIQIAANGAGAVDTAADFWPARPESRRSLCPPTPNSVRQLV